MLKAYYTDTSTSRSEIIEFVLEQKQANPLFRVVDIGGAVNGWTRDIADLVVDIGVTDGERSLCADICMESSWEKLRDIVTRNGIFDYAVCTHTLEDIYNPFLVLRNLPELARGGVITMPSMAVELSHPQSPFWNGYFHHRWIFDFRDDGILIIPKIGMLEALVRTVPRQSRSSEIRYDWSGDLPFEIFMNNYLGPDGKTVLTEFSKLFAAMNDRLPHTFSVIDVRSRRKRYAQRVISQLQRLVGL